MQKKYYKIIIIIVCFALIIVGGSLWFWQKYNDKPGQTAFFTGFTMLDDEETLVWSELVQNSPEDLVQYENKIKEIKTDLAIAKEKDQLLADYNNLAIYEKYLGNYRDSYNAYLESLKLESQARVAWQNFADVLLKMKAYKSSEMAYKKAIELNQYIPESYNKLAGYYQVMGNDIKVEETYKLGIENIKNSMESDTLILNDYANWLVQKKHYDEAIKIYEELILKQPQNKAALEKIIQGIKSRI